MQSEGKKFIYNKNKSSIMKKNLLLIFILFIYNEIFAQSILAGQHSATDYYVDLIPDTIMHVPFNGGNASYDIDINGDGIYDFKFSIFIFNNGAGTMLGSASIIPLNNSQIAFDRNDTCIEHNSYSDPYSFTPICQVFTTNSLIDNNQIWNNHQYVSGELILAYVNSYSGLYGWSCYKNPFNNLIPMYVGVRVILSADTLYGWIKLSAVDFYQVTIDEYACNHGTTGISENNAGENIFKIFPNPSNGNFNISLKKNVAYKVINIFNVTGEKIYSDELKNCTADFTKQIHLNKGTGVYLVTVQTKDAVETKKIYLY